MPYTLSLIAAVDENGAIGKNGALPWHLPKELAYFKEKTLGKPVILGRKTFESFGGRPLKGRPHIVVTRDRSYHAENVQIAHSFKEAFALAKELLPELNQTEIMVIGGGEIYKEALADCNRIYLTEVKITVDGADTFFPTFSKETFQETSRTPSSENGVDYDFVVYEKEKPIIRRA